MTPEYTNELVTLLLLAGLLTVLTLGACAASLVVVHVRAKRRQAAPSREHSRDPLLAYRPSAFDDNCRWLAIKSTDLRAVQSELGLHDVMPCSRGEGLSRSARQRLLVSPAVQGWILVLGPGLPDPGEDVDRCFHLIRRLSRALGHVQFFHGNRALNHHALARAEHGVIRRAYAWSGQTLWNQGKLTQAEIELGLRCFDYGEMPDSIDIPLGTPAVPNCDKVTALAARWSFDPSAVLLGTE